MIHVPILRGGRPYRSLDLTRLSDLGTGEVLAEVSQANPGLIAKDLGAAPRNQAALGRLSVTELLAVCRRAATLFAGAELPIDSQEGTTQTPEEYVQQLSSTSGLPRTLCRSNMEKIRYVLSEMERVLGGLTRGLDLSALEAGFTLQGGSIVSYLAQADTLGVVLPGNSPGVHALWIPAIALRVPLALKPGSREPWTPLRVSQALLTAGCPAEAIGFYPSGHAGAQELLLRCRRSMLFGDAGTVGPWAADPRVQLHGPGFSKVLIGRDEMREWERHLDLLAASVADNGGRSCLNASGIWVPSDGRELATALAQRMARIEARPLDDPEAQLAAFPDRRAAQNLSDSIDRQLRVPGAEDVTATLRSGGRVREVDGCTFILPTVIWCEDPAHPLASCEFLFPFVSVVQAPQEKMTEWIGPTLVATALTSDEVFRRELLHCAHIDRLNLGPIPTSRVGWDQPHEGNLFEHLYRQRALQLEAAL